MDDRNLIQITERGDPRVAPFVSVRERDLTGGADGRFIVEGKVPLSILLTQSRFAVESLFLCESRLAPLSDILKNLPPNVPVYTAPQAMMDEIAGFPIHRGILACAKKGDALPLDGLLAANRLLILTEISNHAILLGAEGPGLPEALIKAAKPVRIPMRAGFDSVNVATAGAIALAHVFSSE